MPLTPCTIVSHELASAPDGPAVVYAIIIACLILGLAPIVVCVMKAKYGMALVGLFFGIFALIGAIRLAKPDSRWARGYTSTKMAAAKARYPKRAARVPADWVPAEDPLDEPAPAHEQDSEWGEDVDPRTLDRTTRRALKKAGKLP